MTLKFQWTVARCLISIKAHTCSPSLFNAHSSHNVAGMAPALPFRQQSPGREGGVRLHGSDWTGSDSSMLPPRTSTSSTSLLSVLQQSGNLIQLPVYTLVSAGWSFPQPGTGSHIRGILSGASSSRHHAPEEEDNISHSSIRNI